MKEAMMSASDVESQLSDLMQDCVAGSGTSGVVAQGSSKIQNDRRFKRSVDIY